VQSRSSTIEICDQLILLYSAMEGLLDNVPADLVSIYEIELYSYLHRSPFYYILSNYILDNFEPSLFEFFLKGFTKAFLKKYL
jgi:hypothetical protein